jgi:oligoendopeptidase F
MAATVAPERRFVPQKIDFADFAQLQPLYSELLTRKLFSAADHERWLMDLSELTAAVDEFGQRRYIDKSCHTDDPEIEKRYMQFVEEIEPKIKPLFFQLQKRLLDSPGLGRLDLKRYAILIRQWQADVDIFREQNVPLQTQATVLVTEYDKISGAMTVQFQGKELTMPQMLRYQEQTDRAVRQASWESSANRRLKDRDANDEIFDKLLSLRQQIAVNASLPDYRAYVWKLYKRFDYTPQLCLEFADAIAQTCVPLVKQLDARRKADLGVESLRPWDLAVDPKNRAPLEPFREDQTNIFIDKTKAIFDRLSPELGEEFESLRRNKNLDLQSRKGKQPGGYQASLEETKQPFIFMNAAGLQRDVEVLLHEGGHAFHHLAAAAVEPLVFLRSAPMEFCEVASMSMEMLGSEHFDVFYNDADAARARRMMIEGVIRFFPWMATIDVFQHWLYTHPGHSRTQRTDQWLSILDRFGGDVDWTGYDAIRQSSWQRQLHLYHNPFYYVEYGIAQLGALQLWLKARQDPNRALSNYRAALQLGGTRPLPDLFSTAGIRFDFSQKMLGPLMTAMSEELASLPS